MQPKSREKLTASVIAVNGGRDRAYLVRETSPDGKIVEHQVVTTGRLIDRLHDRRRIDGLQHAAASRLRDLYERSRLAMGKVRAVDFYVNIGGGEPDLVADERAWRGYRAAMRECHQWRVLLRAVVIDDHWYPGASARMLELLAALDALARHFGILYRRG